MRRIKWTFMLAGLLSSMMGPRADGAVSTFARAGVRYGIDVWESDDGLPQSAVLAMAQTRDGYLWLGTLNGLVRFDGINFTVFDEVNTSGLKSSRIFTLFEDSRSNLWVGTETAGTILVRDGKVQSLPIGAGGAEQRVAALAEDALGAVWLYTMDGQLWRYHEGNTNRFLFAAGRPSATRTLAAETGHSLWIGADTRLSSIDPRADFRAPELPGERTVPVGKVDLVLSSRMGGYWRLANYRVQKWQTNRLERDFGPYPWTRGVSAACEDLDGNLIVGTLGSGVFWYDPQGQAACLSTKEGLSHNTVLSLLVDREGTLWVGTDGGGLNRVKRQPFQALEASRGLTVQSVCEERQQGLWVGFNIYGYSANGAGLLKEGSLEWFGPGQGLMNASVWSMFADRGGRIWAGTWGGLFQWNAEARRFQRARGSEAIPTVVLAMHQDGDGVLWLGTQGGLARWDESEWRLFTTRDGLSANVVRALANDKEGNLWVGTIGGGLNCFRNGQFSSFRSEQELACDDISSLYVDAEGVLWVGTCGRGLARRQHGKWTVYTTQEGLISNSVSYLIEDEQGWLWIGSNEGLMRIRKKLLDDYAAGSVSSIVCRTYGKRDGLPTCECTLGSQPAACRSSDGRLWFPTIKGLASVKPAELLTNTNPPPVLIESVLLDDRPQSATGLRAGPGASVTVPAGKERLEIHYTSLNLAAPERARFRHWLVGHETTWTEVGNIRVAYYSKLPPGTYHFRVTACNEDGVWNETGSTLALVVEPPFWRTWWFLTASVVALLGAIVSGVHYVSTQKLQRQLEALRQQEALEHERARIARDLHDQLGASLTQVALLGELVEADKSDPMEVGAHAKVICQTARDTSRGLDEIVWTVNPSNDTLDGLVTYICKYAQEYLAVAGLRYRLEAPPELPEVSVTPEVRHNVFLAAKEAVTNVVRHARASSVHIRLAVESDRFSFEIEDDGQGLGGMDARKDRNGLRNMRKRMEDVGGSFSISPRSDKGTRVCLTAPLGKS